MSRFALETRRPHESRRASGTRLSPEAGLAVLPVQTVQAGRALNPRRPRRPRGTGHARWASQPFAALFCLGAGRALRACFARESRGTRRAGKAWLALESLVALLTRAPLGSSLSSGTRWAWGAREAFGSRRARFSLLSCGPSVASLSLDARQARRAHGTGVARLPWRTQFPLLSRRAPEASLPLETRQSGGANGTRKTWGAHGAGRARGAPHAGRTLFSSLARQPRGAGQARAPRTARVSLAVVSPGLLRSGALPLREAPGTVVKAWHAGDALVSLLAFLQEGRRAGLLPLGAVPTDARDRVLFNGRGFHRLRLPGPSWQTVDSRNSLQPRHSGGAWWSGDTWGTRHAGEDGVSSRGTGALPGLPLLAPGPLFARHPSGSCRSGLSLLPVTPRRPSDTGTGESHGPDGAFYPRRSLGPLLASRARRSSRPRKPLQAGQALGSRLPLGPLDAHSRRPRLSLQALQSWRPLNSR